MSKQKKVHLLTGANQGDCRATLAKARQLLGERAGEITKVSHLYETEPWGEVDQPNYLNQAIELSTRLSPQQLMEVTKGIETELGRVPRSKWGARIIDIDLLFYANLQINTPDLTIPHPYLHRRNFVLVPMLEIAPLKRHPVFKKNIEQLYLESKDDLEVVLLDDAILPT